MNVGERKEKAENRTRSASRLSLVKKQRLFKMTDIERNMLVKALGDVSRETGPEESAEILSLMEKALRTPNRRLYLSDSPERSAQRLSLCGAEQRRNRQGSVQADELQIQTGARTLKISFFWLA